MNYKSMLKGALALSLGLIVGSAVAATTTADVQKYGATFESTTSAVAPMNDYAYEEGTNITKYAISSGNGETSGWFGAAEDESKIIARTDAAGGQALQLNTDAGTLTNKLESSIADYINTNGIAKAGAYIETEAKFVASDTLDAGIVGGTDDTKFAIYAYADENANPCTTNLVVYHAYLYEDANHDMITDYTNEVFTSVVINTEVYTKLRVEMKQLEVDEGVYQNVFSVSINDGQPLSSTLALDKVLDPTAAGIWFQTIEDSNGNAANAQFASVNFKGTGEVDNLAVGIIQETTTYAIDWTGSANVVVSNATEALTIVPTNVAPDTVVTFYPTEGNVITNVFVGGVAQAFDPASYSVTVSSDTNVVVLAGVQAAPPAPTVITVAQTVGAHGGSISNGNFQAVAGVAVPLTIMADQGYVIAQIVTNGAPVADALGETSVTFDAVFSAEEGANNSIIATFAPDSAWFLDPFVRNKFKSDITTENTQASAIDEAADMIAFGTAPGASTAGIVQYSLSKMTNEFGKVTAYEYAKSQSNSHNGDYWGRSFAAVPPFEAILSCNYMNAGVVVVSPYGGPWVEEGDVSYTVSMDMGASGLAAPKLYPITVNKAGTFLYGTDTAGAKIYKFAIVADSQDATKIGSLQYVASWDFTGGGDLKGIGVGTFNGNDVVYMAKNASRGLWTLDVATGTLTKTAAAIVGEVYQIYTTGTADGTPRLVVAGGDNIYIYGLAADGSLLAAAPVFSCPIRDYCYTATSARYGVTPVDDESRIVLASYAAQKIGYAVVEKKPANLIVRGTFDDGATVEETAVAFGDPAEVTFNAPAGATITAVTTNGVAAQIAEGATSYTFESDCLEQYVYVSMTATFPTYTVDWTGSTNVTVAVDGDAWDGGTAGSFTNGTVVTFTADSGMMITNVAGEAYSPASTFTLTVTEATNIVVLAGVAQPIGRIKPEWAADADTTKFWAWVDANGVTDYANTDYTTEYLLNVATGEDPAPEIKITSIEVGATATTIEIRGTVGRGVVDFSKLNGVLNIAVGSSVTALTPKAIPAANLDVDPEVPGVATVTISNGDGAFFRARVDFEAPQASLTAISE